MPNAALVLTAATALEPRSLSPDRLRRRRAPLLDPTPGPALLRGYASNALAARKRMPLAHHTDAATFLSHPAGRKW